MSNAQRGSSRSHPETAHVTAALPEVLTQRGCSLLEVEQAKTLWQEFLGAPGSSALPGSVESWCAALHYLVSPLSGRSLTQKAAGALYRTSPSTVSGRVKLLTSHTDRAVPTASATPTRASRRKHPAAWRQCDDAEAFPANVIATAQQRTRPALPPALDDAGWMAIFSEVHRLLSQLYSDKTHVEILRFLDHVELNLVLAGYRAARDVVLDRFAKLFPRLGLQAAKGRDPLKFVYLQDVFGTPEPFVLLKLEHEDG